jgi:S1-C subfamily serine protease
MLFVRVPQSEPRSEDDLGVPLPLIMNGRTLWRGSDDADLAVVAVPNLSGYKDLHGILLSDFGGEDDIYQGASVVVLGYPELLGPDYQITPIARGGIVAWTNPNGRLDHTFLVDANIFSGNSGGPVFHTSGGLTRNGGMTIGGAPKLIGIVSKDAYEEATVHAGPMPANSINSQTGEVTPITAQVLNIGGIGIIEPIVKAKKLIIDFLDPYRTITHNP